MSIISLFHGAFCGEDDVLGGLAGLTGYRRVSDRDVAAAASRIAGLPESNFFNAFSSRTSVFNRFTHEKERSIACLRLAVAEMVAVDGLLLAGFSSRLVPRTIDHVLSVCLIADMTSRVERATAVERLPEKEADRLIRSHEEDCHAWFDTLEKEKDPWKSSLYDMVIPTDKMSAPSATALIAENAAREVVTPTAASRKRAADFLLSSRVGVALAGEGHNVDVEAVDGVVTITINRQVLMLGRLEEELKTIAGQVPGVEDVVTRVGQNFHQADVYRKFSFEAPSKVLLVDDEREFVQTLSERLIMRDVGSAVAYDGESALDLVREDEPDVMILDLKMPGIDGIEVLKRVKATNPEIEVIILTGHGSEADRDVCMRLGAYAYFQKPVDIDILSKALKEANKKVRRKRETEG